MIRLRDVSLSLGTSARDRSVLFWLPALDVDAGEAIALIGPSGCGKSTLLNLVAGLRRADSGEVTVAGRDLARLSVGELDRHRGSHCGMVFQSFHLLAPFTAVENVEIGLRFGARQIPRRQRRDRAVELLRRVGLGDRLQARPGEMSVGERQRVAIARAIAGEPSLLLADEPTGSLDPETGREIFALLREVAAEENRTLLMVTHDPELAAAMPRVFDCSCLIETRREPELEAKPTP